MVILSAGRGRFIPYSAPQDLLDAGLSGQQREGIPRDQSDAGVERFLFREGQALVVLDDIRGRIRSFQERADEG